MIHPTPLPRPSSLGLTAASCFARALDALETHTNAPLRLCEHASGPECEVFELQEEFELGPPGRRFVIAVRHDDPGQPSVYPLFGA